MRRGDVFVCNVCVPPIFRPLRSIPEKSGTCVLHVGNHGFLLASLHAHLNWTTLPAQMA